MGKECGLHLWILSATPAFISHFKFRWGYLTCGQWAVGKNDIFHFQAKAKKNLQDTPGVLSLLQLRRPHGVITVTCSTEDNYFAIPGPATDFALANNKSVL